MLPQPRHRRQGWVLDDLRVEGYSRQSPSAPATRSTRSTPSGHGALAAPPRPTQGCFETKRNKQCYYGWLYLSTDSSKLMTIRDWAALLNPSPRRVNTPAPLSLHHSSPQRSLLRSVLESLCSCSSCLFPSRVFNQIASTTIFFLPYST